MNIENAVVKRLAKTRELSLQERLIVLSVPDNETTINYLHRLSDKDFTNTVAYIAQRNANITSTNK